MGAHTFVYVLPFILSAILLAASVFRDRNAQKTRKEGAASQEAGISPIPWASAGIVVLASVVGSLLCFVVDSGPHVMVIVFNASWSFLVFVALVRFLRRAPRTVVVAALSLLLATVSLLFAVGLD